MSSSVEDADELDEDAEVDVGAGNNKKSGRKGNGKKPRSLSKRGVNGKN